MPSIREEEIRDHFNNYLNENLEYLKENHPNTWKDDLHHYAFNQDYFIIGRRQAEDFMGYYRWDITQIVKEYEQDNFGECNTDLSEPEKVVNMYAYIIGERIVQEYLNNLEKEESKND